MSTCARELCTYAEQAAFKFHIISTCAPELCTYAEQAAFKFQAACHAQALALQPNCTQKILMS